MRGEGRQDLLSQSVNGGFPSNKPFKIRNLIRIPTLGVSEVTFTRSDGLRVCHCGTTYSPILGVCPNCHELPVQPKRPVVYRKYMCEKGYPCTQGGLDGICCLSCHRFNVCQEPCNTAEILKKNREQGFKPDRCEHMTGGEEEEPKEDEM